MSYFVCTYGNFSGREDKVRESIKNGCYYLHSAARYPSAIDKIQKGDHLLLNAWGCTLASGCAVSSVEILPSEDWKYRIRVDKWTPFDATDYTQGCSAYGIQEATIIGGQFSLVKKVNSKWAVRQLSEMSLLDGMDVMKRDCFQLSLPDVASWYYNDIVNNTCVEAGVPILQRGLVWTAQQDELLWDSLMRKIPIGALVLCPAIKSQSRGIACSHHIMDGQQRANAIAEGFDGDPFVEKSKSGDMVRPNKRILWLDLKPDLNALSNTSRKHLLRVTTPAHPWGYEITDEAGGGSCLDFEKIRDARDRAREELRNCAIVDSALRPHTSEMIPFRATLPIPVGFMTRSFLDLDEEIGNETQYWKNVAKRLETAGFPFSGLKQRLLQFVHSPNDDDTELRHKAYCGIKNAMECSVVAVTAPRDVIGDVDGTSASDSIEHMFTRINRQGTRLDGEDLIYSSIKSYWPGVQEGIDKAAEHRMPPSRLLRLALQVSESDRTKQFVAGVSLREVRKIAGDITDDGKGRGNDAQRLIIPENPQNQQKSELQGLCEVVDKWLERRDGEGLPRVLKTAIANNAPELYLLLLLLARHNADMSRRFVVALSLYLYFFDYRVKISRRAHVVGEIVRTCYREAFTNTQDVIVQVVKNCQGRDPQNPWLLPLVNFSDDVITNEFEKVSYSCDNLSADLFWWECFGRFRCNRDLLLFAEADFIEKEFPEYDPARKELWAEYNRPWDYDHIVPQDVVNKWDEQGSNSWWLWCMGNMAAIPLEENRSKGNGADWHYYDKHPELHIEQLKGFVSDKVSLVEYRRCVWKRFQGIYDHIYQNITAYFS